MSKHTHNNEAATAYSWTISELEKEIAWNERRLTNLIWGEDDRRQTEDYVADLRRERQRLLAAVAR